MPPTSPGRKIEMKSEWLWTAVVVASLFVGCDVGKPEPEKPAQSQNVVIENSPSATKNSPAVEIPFHPNAVAKSLAAVPGAIVCPDLASVKLVFDRYSDHWEDTGQDAVTNGQSRQLRGNPATEPHPEDFNCALVIPGTPIQVENADAFTTGIPMVSAKLPNGTMIRGVTLPGMLSKL
jgi:hypothetical protein